MLTVIASMDYEVSELRKKLRSVASVGGGQRSDPGAQSNLADLKVIGVGKERAQTSVRRLLEKRASGEPDSLLLLGLAGAVDPILRTGDLVLSSHYIESTQSRDFLQLNVTNDAKKKSLTPDPLMWELATTAFAGEGQKPFYMDSLTVGQVVSAPEQKKSIAGAYHVGIVEMEDYWVAEVAAEFGVAFLSARVVLDTADQALPGWLLGLSHSRSKAVLSLVGRPWRIPPVMRLARQRPVAQKALTRFALRFLAEAANANKMPQTLINAGDDSQNGLKVSA